jgi:single-stranded-DNA-specific exonuclease
MGPFGIRNRRPVFFAPGIRVQGAREVGSGHLKLRMRKGSAALDAIGFGLMSRLPPGAVEGRVMDAAFHLEENHYRGRISIQARLLDLRPEGSIEP